MNDSEYHKFKSHSKHSIAPALRSGIDYQFFTVEGRGRNKANESMDDGTLLHCLALERHEFKNRYHVANDYDELHKNNKHYFQTIDEFKTAVAEHNRKHQAFIKDLKEAVKAYNKDIKSGSKELVSTYDELPPEHKTAQLTDAGKRKAISRFKEIALLSISVDVTPNQLKSELDNKINLLSKYLQVTYSEAELQKLFKAPTSTKSLILNDFIQVLRLNIDEMSDEKIFALIPETIIDSLLTQTSKNKAVNAYNKHIKETGVTTLDDKAPPSELFATLNLANKLPETLSKLPKVYHHKLINVGNKKGDKDTYTVADVSTLYEQVYKQFPSVRSELIEAEKQQASRDKKELVTKEQLDHAERIIDALYAHPLANKWLTLEGNDTEVAMFWNEYVSHPSLEALEQINKVLQENREMPESGEQDLSDDEALPSGVRQVLCKAKVDIVNLLLNVVIDVKFVSSVDMDKMNNDAAKFTYHIQDAYYSRGFNKVMETHPDGAQTITKFVFIFVEKDAPTLGKEETKPIRIRVGSYRPADKDRANELIDASFLEIEHWVGQNHFDGFEEEEELFVPQYQARREMEYLAQHKQRMAEKVKDSGNNGREQQVTKVELLGVQPHTNNAYPSFDELVNGDSTPNSNAA
ncbi:PD-(D/E)XK nuclease-like domain-containing protein (plasmid) [Vibrio harveyi]|uniref:PD-(D/E)XK nuclease-like domain-containing protein n=1 Tax=Vibrio harveyi TaxID=669 RepID=UPI0031BB00C2